MNLRALAIVLAGGKGTRLAPLTSERAKPAVSFAGKYRIVDFVLSNLVNSGIYSIYVLVQFKSQSLLLHLKDGWQFSNILGNQFIIPVPAQMRSAGETWYRGTADAIHQNINLIEQSKPDIVVVFGADHVYRMNVAEMIEFHRQVTADVTVATIPVDRTVRRRTSASSRRMADGHIVRFIEKDPEAPGLPGDPEQGPGVDGQLRVLGRCAAADGLRGRGGQDLQPTTSAPTCCPAGSARTASSPTISPTTGSPASRPAAATTGATSAPSRPTSRPTWRSARRTRRSTSTTAAGRCGRPATRTRRRGSRSANGHEPGQAIHSLVAGGSIIAGLVRDSVLGRNVLVHPGAVVEECVILDNCEIGPGASLRRTILDKNARVPAGEKIGFDREHDRQRHHVSETGIVVVSGTRSPVDLATVGI